MATWESGFEKIMPKKRSTLKRAAEQLAAIAEGHLAKLRPAERAARLQAFREVVANVGGSHAKSEAPRETPRSRLSALKRA